VKPARAAGPAAATERPRTPGTASPLPRVAAKNYFGHERELDLAERTLASARVVVLVGPGGAGKTRVALTIASRADGATFCDFSAASTRGEAIRVMARVVGITLGSGGQVQAAAQVHHALAARANETFVLDNLETVADAKDLFASWVAAGPSFLATSRTRGAIPGVHEVALDPLTPTEAVQLFTDRARAVAHELTPDGATLELVKRLGGSPLAIELAAARAHVLSPTALLDRFSRHLDLVKTSAEVVPGRHRSLRAVVMSSWELSSPADRDALAACSVFVGSFDATAAEAVIGPDAIDRLESLLACSLLARHTHAGGEARFELNDTVRDFAREQLAAAPSGQERARRAHARHFRELAKRQRDLTTNAEPEALRAMELDADNLLAAFRLEGRSALSFHPVLTRHLPADLEIALLESARTTSADDASSRAEVELTLTRAYRRGGRAEQNLAQARAAMLLAEATGDDELLAEGGYMLTNTLLDSGRTDEAIACGERAVEVGERAGAFGMVARVLGHLGFAMLERGDTARASRHAERVLAIGRQHRFLLIECFGENLLGAIHGSRGDLDGAARHLERAVDLARRTRHRLQEGVVLGNLGKAYTLAGKIDEARSMIEQALRLARLEGSRYVTVPQLTNLVLLDIASGRLAEARARAAEAEQLAIEVEHRRQVVVAAQLLGWIAIEEGRHEEGRADFARALDVARALQHPAGEALASAGLGVALARTGQHDAAHTHHEEARRRVPDSDWEARAVIDARRAIALLSKAADTHEAREPFVAEARALLDAARERASASIEIRVALHLADRTLASLDADASPTLELVTRAGARPAQRLPMEADLAFDARSCSVLVDGRAIADLRKKPQMARLLEVVLAHPCDILEKDRLYREAWSAELRNVSQAAAIYKAVDRLSRLLDADTRRFFRWDERGALVLLAASPALLRVPTSAQARSS
jgi:predicted ATPase